MVRMRAAQLPIRISLALLLGLLLSVRLLSPIGFMPVFARGSVAIVPCADGEPAPAGAHHDGPNHGTHGHEHCPYAADASPATTPDPPLFAAVPNTHAAPILSSAPSSFRGLRRLHERPPLRGPPLPA
jgi:hypothetical protein